LSNSDPRRSAEAARIIRITEFRISIDHTEQTSERSRARRSCSQLRRWTLWA
jgi:hypothetical protein